MKTRRYEVADMVEYFQYFIFVGNDRVFWQINDRIVKNLLVVLIESYRNSRKITYRSAKILYIFRFS